MLTRLPGPRTLVWQGISHARPWDLWPELADTPRDQGLEWCHDGMAQRWRVVSSPAAMERAAARVPHAQPRAWDALEQPRVHGQAPRGERPEAAHAPAQAQGGVRWLKAPVWLGSSLFVKPPCRIPGRLMGMPFALLGSAVTPRRRRGPRARQHDTLPKQLKPLTARPTVRGGFHLLDGSPRVRVTGPGTVHDRIDGRNEGQVTSLRLGGAEVCRLSHMSPG